MTKKQIETEAVKRYIKGSASYHAFIFGAEWVLNEKDNETDKTSDKSGQD